jgi:hypothetical protein
MIFSTNGYGLVSFGTPSPAWPYHFYNQTQYTDVVAQRCDDAYEALFATQPFAAPATATPIWGFGLKCGMADATIFAYDGVCDNIGMTFSLSGTNTFVGINTNTVLLGCSVSQSSTTSTVTYTSYRGKTPYIGQNFSMGGYDNAGNNNAGVTYFTLTGADSGAKTVTFTNAAGATEPGGLGNGTSVTAPGYALDVAGDINCSGYFRSGGTAGVTHATGAPTSLTTAGGIVTAFSTSSDERLKETSIYEGGLKEIISIHPVRFHWNQRGQRQTGFGGDQMFIGFTAQDVQKVIPEAVTGTEKAVDGPEEYLGFDDRPIIAALVNAVKELAKEVELLKREKKHHENHS